LNSGDVLIEYSKYFTEKISEYMKTLPKNPSISTLNNFICILSDIKNCETELGNLKFIEFFKSLESHEIDFFKSLMLKYELYEPLNLIKINENEN
jgi:hypothetical protein